MQVVDHFENAGLRCNGQRDEDLINIVGAHEFADGIEFAGQPTAMFGRNTVKFAVIKKRYNPFVGERVVVDGYCRPQSSGAVRACG